MVPAGIQRCPHYCCPEESSSASVLCRHVSSSGLLVPDTHRLADLPAHTTQRSLGLVKMRLSNLPETHSYKETKVQVEVEIPLTWTLTRAASGADAARFVHWLWRVEFQAQKLGFDPLATGSRYGLLSGSTEEVERRKTELVVVWEWVEGRASGKTMLQGNPETPISHTQEQPQRHQGQCSIGMCPYFILFLFFALPSMPGKDKLSYYFPEPVGTLFVVFIFYLFIYF